MSGPVVVVGAGLAGAHVVATLREGGFEGPITLIGAENQRPYERPPLSKGILLGDSRPDDAFVHAADFYDDHGITTRFAHRVASIERSAHTIQLASGETVPYEHLVLTTGSRARLLPAGHELGGVHTLRTLPDSLSLKAALDAPARVVLIGGGWIGLEVAAAARTLGHEVTVLDRDPLPLARILGDRIGAYFAELHRSHGVDLRTNVAIDELLSEDGRVTGVRVGGEVIPADLVIVGVGALPNVELAEAAGLAVDNGVVVDEHLRTADPAILAAGDVANATNTTLGHRLRVEHWDNAIRQGDLAAATILGRDTVYDWQPYFYSDQFDLGMEYVGRADATAEVVVRGDEASGEFIAFWLDDGVLRAAMNVNTWDVNDTLRGLLGARISPERLANPSIPLADLAD